MIDSVKRFAWQQWRSYSQGRPGKRFQERYRRRQESGQGKWGVSRILNLTLGLLIVAVSAVTIFVVSILVYATYALLFAV